MTKDTNFFDGSLQALVPWWETRLNVNGDNMDVDMNDMLRMCHPHYKPRIKLLAPG